MKTTEIYVQGCLISDADPIRASEFIGHMKLTYDDHCEWFITTPRSYDVYGSYDLTWNEEQAECDKFIDYTNDPMLDAVTVEIDNNSKCVYITGWYSDELSAAFQEYWND